MRGLHAIITHTKKDAKPMTPHSPYPAPALRPLPSFGGTIAERIARSPIAAAVMGRSVTRKINLKKGRK